MTYRRANITLARLIAPTIDRNATWDEIRTQCDLATYSDMTGYQLDRLADMTSRVLAATKPRIRNELH